MHELSSHIYTSLYYNRHFKLSRNKISIRKMIYTKYMFCIFILIVVMITNGMARYVAYQENDQSARRNLKGLWFSNRYYSSCPDPFQLDGNGDCVCSDSDSDACDFSLECPSGSTGRSATYVNGAFSITCSN